MRRLTLLLCGFVHAQASTTITLSSASPVAPRFGQVVTLTAQVTPAAAGTVSFMDGGVLVGVGMLNSNGVAQATTLSLPAGVHSLRAVYESTQSTVVPYVVTAVSGAGFPGRANFPAGMGPFSVAVGDFDGDGNADLAVANFGSNNVSVLLGNGAGSFQPAADYHTGAGSTSVTVADFNADGKRIWRWSTPMAASASC